MGDANMRCLQKGDILQLERKGYFRVDQPLLKPTSPIILFAIPDGRMRSTLPQPTAAAASTPAQQAPSAARGSIPNEVGNQQPPAAASATGATLAGNLQRRPTAANPPPTPAAPTAAAPGGSKPGVSKVSLHHMGNAAPAAAPANSTSAATPPTPLVGAAKALNSAAALSPPAVLQKPTGLPSLSTQPSAPIEGLPAGSPLGSPLKQHAKSAETARGPSLLGGPSSSRGAASPGMPGSDNLGQPGSSLPGSPADSVVRQAPPVPATTPPPTPAASMELPKGVQYRPV